MTKKFHISTLPKLVLSAALLVATMASCEYQSLEEMNVMERSEFTLSFAHSNVDSIPSSYRVAFYPADDQTRENITNGYMLFDLITGAHKLSLPCGSYKVTAWNHDTEHVLTNGYGTRDMVTATTQAYRSRGAFDTPKVVDSLYHGQTILDYPDYMVHANVENFTLQQTEAEQKLILTPDSMVVTVDLNIGGIRGLAEVLEARGSINNVAGKRYIARDNFTEDSVVVIFDCTCLPEMNTVKARFYLFGLEPSVFPGLDHKVILYFWLNNCKVYIPLDITSLVANARRTQVLDVHVEDLNIDLREYVSSSSGYEVTIDEWDNIHIGINL